MYAKWLDDTKIVDGDLPAVRSRLVQFLYKGRRHPVHFSNQVFQTDLVIGFITHRLGRSARQTRWQVRLVAFFHALASGKIALVPPMGLVESGCCWFLQTAMYGTREASKCWSTTVIDTVAPACCASVQVVYMTSTMTRMDSPRPS